MTLSLSELYPNGLPEDIGHLQADIRAAKVFLQRWQRHDSGILTGFDVLALDAEQALEMGALVLAETGADPAQWSNVSNYLLPEPSVLRVITILGTEPSACAAVRERTFAARQGDAHDQVMRRVG